MRTRSPLLITLLVSTLCGPAHSAVTCVLNKDSKKFESSAAKQAKDPKDLPTPCDTDTAKQTLEGIQLAINSAGTKLVSPTVIVNTDKLPLPDSAKQIRPITSGASHVVETDAEMLIPGTPVKATVEAATATPTPTPPQQPHPPSLIDQRMVKPVVLAQQSESIPAAPVDPARQARTYRLKLNDLTVRLALNRWLKEANMQLAYEAGEEFKASVEGDYVGTIPDVLFKLMTSLKQTKYPLRACEYDNRVVLVVHRDDVCPLEDE